MSATEQRLRELLQAAAPEVSGIRLDRLAAARRRGAVTPWVVVGSVLFVAALAVGTAALATRTNRPTPALHSPSTSPPSVTTGHLRGTLLISPPMAKQYGTAGSIVIAGPRRLTVAVGNSGRFSAALPPGRYTVTGRAAAFNNGQSDCIARSGSVTIRAKQTIEVAVLCSEK